MFLDYNSIDDWYANWKAERIRMQRHALPEEKGIPVAGTGMTRRRYHSKKDSSRSSGVSGNSRVLPHRYMDEGDNGKGHRREIRRKERVAVQAEISEGLWDYLVPADLDDYDF